MAVTDGQIDIAGGVYEAPPAPNTDIRVTGTVDASQLGGKTPQTGSLTISGFKASISDAGAFEKGDVLYGRFVARVVEVGQKDKLDKETGVVMEAVQHHKAVVLDFILTDREEL